MNPISILGDRSAFRRRMIFAMIGGCVLAGLAAWIWSVGADPMGAGPRVEDSVRRHPGAAWPECVQLQKDIDALKSSLRQDGRVDASLQAELRARISRRNDIGC